MIKIKKMNKSYRDLFELGDATLYMTKDKDPSILLLQHNAFKLKLISSNGKRHTVKIGSEILKLSTEQLLSICVKVYPKYILNKIYYVDCGTPLDYVRRFTEFKDEESHRWAIVLHENTLDIFSQLFSSNSKEMMSNHINEQMKKMLKRNGEYDTTLGKVMWELYKLLATREDVGIQLIMHSEEFRPIANLLIADYLFEEMYNSNAKIEDSFFHTKPNISDRFDQLTRLLNIIGKFTANYANMNGINGVFDNAVIRGGLPSFLARNILEDKYTKSHVINNNYFNYLDLAYIRRTNLMEKIREFLDFMNLQGSYPFAENFMESQGLGTVLTAQIPKVPEPAIQGNPEEIKVIKTDNSLNLEGININYDNMEVILYRDVAMAFEPLKERVKEILDGNISYDDELDKQNEKANLLMELQKLFKKVQDARYRLRYSDKDLVDFNAIEKDILDTSTLLQNSPEISPSIGESFGISFGEEIKLPHPIKKISNNIKDGMALAGRAIKTNSTLNHIGQFVDDVTGLGYIKGKLNANKVKKDQKKKEDEEYLQSLHDEKEARKQEKEEFEERRKARRGESIRYGILFGMSVNELFTVAPIKMSGLVYAKGEGYEGIKANVEKASLNSVSKMTHNYIEGLKQINTPESLRALNESHAFFTEFYNTRKDFLNEDSNKVLKSFMEASLPKK